MPEADEREWRFYLYDLIDFAIKVSAYTKGFDQAGFITNGLIYDAAQRKLERIGEAATHIPNEIRSAIRRFLGG